MAVLRSEELNQAIKYRDLIRLDSRWLVIVGLIITVIAFIFGIIYNSSLRKPAFGTYVIGSFVILGFLILGVGVNNSVVPFIPYSAARTDEQLIHNNHVIKTDKWEMNISAGPGVSVPGSYESKNENSSNNDMIKRIHFDKVHRPQKSFLMKL